MNKPITIFWFRRDLRLHDNAGLSQALQGDVPVLPIFIFDSNLLNPLPRNDARVTFIHQTLLQMQKTLAEKANSGIALYYGTPLEVFEKITERYPVKAVYTNRDYEPYALTQDEELTSWFRAKNIAFHSFQDHVFFEENAIVKEDGTPYTVYTPYARKWLYKFRKTSLKTYQTAPYFHNLVNDKSFSNCSLADMGFVPSPIQVSAYTLHQEFIYRYETVRNFPAVAGTSRLSAHLRFGTVSIREVLRMARASANETFLKELIWREFFIQVLRHFPHTATQEFKPGYSRIAWRNNPAEFERWKQGETGYPLVDAGMRELNKTGFMHNRVRMVTASFLCKHLLIDWRWGEAYFAEKLLDYEMASNVGNWQWVAGCGTDAAPYFRIFNPTEQLRRFDPEGIYIRSWVANIGEPSYPAEIISNAQARARCLQTYKAAVTN